MERTDLKTQISKIAERIQTLRTVTGLSEAEMSRATGVSEADYRAYEAGNQEFGFQFIYDCANRFAVDAMDLIVGESPKHSYTLTRKDEGLPIARRQGFSYVSKAPLLHSKGAEFYSVVMPYNESEQDIDIKLSTHSGMEFDIVKNGSMRIQIGDKVEELYAGDTIFFNGAIPHGMIATGGDACEIYALLMTDEEEASETARHYQRVLDTALVRKNRKTVTDPFVDVTLDSNGILSHIAFPNADRYNFAFDCIDAIAKKSPKKLAMLHVSAGHEARRFTFEDISRYSSKAAHYLESLGIKKGDKVLLVLKRHFQFWYILPALHKIGAIGIPATNLLRKHDFEYRFQAAGVSAIICTADGTTAEEAEAACASCPDVKIKIMVGKNRLGWHDFDQEVEAFQDIYARRQDSACGEDMSMMFFTSGTTGYPKIAVHSHKYSLGHYTTARFWHNVNPDGLHFTISETGWAKSMWGKYYGQWMNEGAIFTYDFDKFDAKDILPMFKQYHITTLCAPPTMYRFFIKEDLLSYDLTSLEYCTTAGEALNPETFEQWKRATGLSIMEGFGQTETTLSIYNPVGTIPRLGSMGRPNPLYDMDIVLADGTPAPAGETGEIIIRTDKGIPCGLFSGYYQDEERTSEVWHDGMYHTGDTAYKDEDGFYWYVGRTDDLIKSSGYRIGPFEIESVIMELPYVMECAVIGVPDPDGVRGQIVKAFIVLKDKEGSDALKKEIQTYVKDNTAPYKYPRIISFREELPKTISGKIRRTELRKDY